MLLWARSDVCLEAEDLVLQLADRASLGVSNNLGSLLHGADHGGRTAHEDLGVVGGGREAFLETISILLWVTKKGRGKAYLDHVRSDKTDTTSPASRGVVEHIVHTEPIILLLELVQLLLEQDVLGVDVGKDQVHLGGVVTTVPGTVADDGLDDLQHGGDTSTTGDHTNVTAHVGGVDHGTLGTAHLHGVTDLQGGQVLGDVTLGVRLHEEVKVTGIFVGGDRSVGAQDLLGLTVDVGGERDVLTDGETEDIGGTGEGETVDADVVGDVGFFLEDEVLELVGDEDLSGLCDLSVISVVLGRFT